MKGHVYNGGIGNIRGRQIYVIVLVLTFVAAVLGVMLLHKVRERRVFTMLVKEKDRQLISLHLLLQKERDHYKEAKRKVKEMKANLYSVRTQKIDLESRISELKSTISSLKEEQRVLETTLEEKQKEIKFLRAKETSPHTANPRETNVTETLKHRDSDIEDPKQHLEIPTKIWSVSTEDPSSLALNSTIDIQHQTQPDELGNQNRGDKIQGTKEDGLALDEVKGNPNSNKTDADTEVKAAKEEDLAISGDTENQSLQGGEEGRLMHMNSRGMQEIISGSDDTEKESAYANDSKGKRWRLLARQQRRGGVVHNRRYRMNGQRTGRYKRIMDEELQKLGMQQGETETGRNVNVKGELGWDNEMLKTKRIGVDKQNEKKMEINVTKEGIEEMQNKTTDVLSNAINTGENYAKPGEPEKNNNAAQVRLETSDDESMIQSNQINTITEKNEEAEEAKERDDYFRESEAGQEEEKAGSDIETEEVNL